MMGKDVHTPGVTPTEVYSVTLPSGWGREGWSLSETWKGVPVYRVCANITRLTGGWNATPLNVDRGGVAYPLYNNDCVFWLALKHAADWNSPGRRKRTSYNVYDAADYDNSEIN